MTSEKMKQEVGASFEKPHISVHRHGMFTRFWNFQDMVTTRNTILEKQLASNGLPDFVDKVQELYQVANQALRADFTSATPEILWETYQTVCDTYRDMCVYAYAANLLDRPLSDAAKEGISGLKPNMPEAEYDEYLLALTRNPKANFMYDFDLGSIKLILDEADRAAVAEHIDTWQALFAGGAGASDDNSKTLAEQRFNELNALPEAELQEKREEIQDQYIQSAEAIKKLENELSIPGELRQKLSLLRDAILLKETRKFYMSQLEKGTGALFEAIAGVVGLEAFHTAYLLPNEVQAALLSNDRSVTDAAVQGFTNNIAYVITAGETTRFANSGVDEVIGRYNLAEELQPPEQASAVTDTTTKGPFKGFVSCQGYIEGPVRIVNGSQDFHKVQEGDILVTPITTPEYIVIFDKVHGMITYDGAGITSHPATLSREYKIPAILGVKELAGILEDGNIVVIDANNNEIRLK
jgi:phosphohistidine swiveling domain-containing protein